MYKKALVTGGDALGGLSLCVNAAAIPMESVLDERAYRVNLRSPYGITAHAAAVMAELKGVSGQIVAVDGGYFLAGVPETRDPNVAGLGWSGLRRRWNQDTIDQFKAESDWL